MAAGMLAVLVVLVPDFLSAAAAGAIRGTVVDEGDKRPAPLAADGAGGRAGPVADSVRSQETPVQDIGLAASPEPEPPQMVLPPLTVTAPAWPSPTPSSTQVEVPERTLQQTPGSFLNIKEAIKNAVPGAVEASEHLHFHGGHEVGYFVNGAPIPDNSVFGQFSSLIDPRIVKSLEVITGGFPAEFGDRTSGIVNIVTKSGADLPNHLEVSSTLGTSGIRELTLQGGGGGKLFSGIFLARLAHTDRYIMAPTFRDIHDRGDSLLLFANASLNLTSRDTLRFLGLAGGANIQIPNTPVEQDLGLDNRERERNHFETLGWDHRFGDDLTMAANLYHHGIQVRLLENANSTPFISNERRNVDYYGAKGDLTFRGLEGHTLEAGGNVYLVRVSERFSVVPNPLDPAFPPFTDGPRVTRGHELSAYLQDQWVPVQGLTVNVGLRYDLFVGLVPEGMLSPRVGLTYRIAPTDTRLFASVDRLFNPPPLEGIKLANSPLTGELAQEPVRAERDTYLQAGVEQRLPWATARLAGWLRREKHFLDHEEIGNTTVFVPVNIAYGKSYGVDVDVQTVPWRGWSAQMFYALGYSMGRGIVTGGVFNRNAEPGSGSAFFLDHDQRHTMAGTLRYEDKAHDWWGTFAVKYGSGFTDGGGPQHLPGGVTFDLAAEKTFRLASWMRASLRVEVINLLDKRFFLSTQGEFVGTHTNIPRTVMVTVRGEF